MKKKLFLPLLLLNILVTFPLVASPPENMDRSMFDFGLKIGSHSAGMTSMGLVQQDMLPRPSYGAFVRYNINNVFGICVSLNYIQMGNRNMPLGIPIRWDQSSTDSEAVKGKKSDEALEFLNDAMVKVEERVLKQLSKIQTKKEMTLAIEYITLPITADVSFRVHNQSIATNVISFGPQFGFLLKATKTEYNPGKGFLKPKTTEEWEWEWADTESCSKCVENIDYTKEVLPLDLGMTIGYALELNFGLIIGGSYYESFRKIFNRDKNSFWRQRRNFSLELFAKYNIMSLISMFS